MGFTERSRLSLKSVILLAIVEFLFEAAAHFYSIIWSDGQVATVKQRVDILPQQKAVSGAVASTVSVGSDVGGI
jgi:hypothetical protein